MTVNVSPPEPATIAIPLAVHTPLAPERARVALQHRAALGTREGDASATAHKHLAGRARRRGGGGHADCGVRRTRDRSTSHKRRARNRARRASRPSGTDGTDGTGDALAA